MMTILPFSLVQRCIKGEPLHLKLVAAAGCTSLLKSHGRLAMLDMVDIHALSFFVVVYEISTRCAIKLLYVSDSML